MTKIIGFVMVTNPTNRFYQNKPSQGFGMVRWLFRSILILIFFAVIFAGWHLLKNPNFMPIQRVKLEATYQHVDQKTLAAIVTPYVTQAGFFSLPAEQLKSAVLAQPWVYTVWIKRIWPDQIIIQVTEQQAVAIWNNNSLLNPEGDEFAPAKKTFPANLPKLSGPEGQQQLVWQQWQQFNSELAALKLTVAELDLNSRGSWQLILDNNIKVIVGRNDVEQRFNRFMANYPKNLADHAANIASIDLRYGDGFAVMPR